MHSNLNDLASVLLTTVHLFGLPAGRSMYNHTAGEITLETLVDRYQTIQRIVLAWHAWLVCYNHVLCDLHVAATAPPIKPINTEALCNLLFREKMTQSTERWLEAIDAVTAFAVNQLRQNQVLNQIRYNAFGQGRGVTACALEAFSMAKRTPPEVTTTCGRLSTETDTEIALLNLHSTLCRRLKAGQPVARVLKNFRLVF